MQDGQPVHAELREVQAPETAVSTGETAVYTMLGWKNGTFKLLKESHPQQVSIQQPWDFLLLEGLRQIDEQHAVPDQQTDEDPAELFSNLSDADVHAIQELLDQEVNRDMANKLEQLQSILDNLISTSSDIVGAVVVDNDGLLLAKALSGNFDGNRVAAVTAGLISLAGRSAQQLGQGAVRQTLIQAENGNIVAIRAAATASFVALAPTGVNLGMTFLECREAVDSITKIL